MEERTEFLLHGDALIQAALPASARIFSAPPPLPVLSDLASALVEAVENPLGRPPLSRLLGRGARAVVSFDDPDLLVPPPLKDPRRTALAALLDHLESCGAAPSTVRLLWACGLGRRPGWSEVKKLLGAEILDRVGRDNVFVHDGEDRQGLIYLGSTAQGEEVEVSRRLVECDVAIHLSVVDSTLSGGWSGPVSGLGGYRCLRGLESPRVLGKGGLGDPETSARRAVLARMGETISRKANVFNVELVLDNRAFPPWLWPFSVYGAAERPPAAEWLLSRLAGASGTATPLMRELALGLLKSAYGVAEVRAGDPDEAFRAALPTVLKQQNVPVAEQYDVVVLGVPSLFPRDAPWTANPLHAACFALGRLFQLYRGRPLAKRGGIVILHHPCRPRFAPRHAPYRDFWREVLPRTLEPEEMRSLFEESYAARGEYVAAYRSGAGCHGSHPFFAWYAAAEALSRLTRIIVAGAEDPGAARRMGFKPARSLDHALYLAREELRGDISLAVLRAPPFFGVNFDHASGSAILHSPTG